MSILITDDINANSYLTIEEADDLIATYSTDRLADWNAKSDELKAKHLIYASEFFDNLGTYKSKVMDENQLLAFPRVAFKDLSGRLVFGTPQLIRILVSKLASSAKPLSVESVRITAEKFGAATDNYGAGGRLVWTNELVGDIVRILTTNGWLTKSKVVNMKRG